MFPIEAFRNTLEKAVAIFNRHQLRYHLTGGVTSVLYGEPRMTQDIDIVVENRSIAAQLDAFADSLEQYDFLFDRESIRHAIKSEGMFQLFDNAESLKLDIYPRELIPGELARSERFEVFEGLHLPVVSLADAAGSKLIWASKGSHKSRRDLRRIFQNADKSDQHRIREIAQQFQLASLLDEILAESDEIDG